MRAELLEKLSPVTEEEKILLADKRADIDRSLYMTDNRNIVRRQKILTEGCPIAIRPHTRFVHFPEHTHDYVELIYMVSGSTTHIINGERVVLQSGELLLLSKSARQEILPAGEGDIAVNFIALPSFFDKTLSMLEPSPLQRFLADALKNEGGQNGYFHFKVSDVLPIQNLVENLVWSLLQGQAATRTDESTMGLLFLYLTEYTDRLALAGAEERALFTALQYIETHYADGSLQALSDILHYDLCFLSRLIKQKTGKTYTALIQQCRLERACYLLKSTALSVADIAAAVGYENKSYFYRLFCKQYGRSPRAFRQQ